MSIDCHVNPEGFNLNYKVITALSSLFDNRDLDWIRVAKFHHLHFLESFNCLQALDQHHGKGSLTLFNYLQDILVEREKGTLKDAENFPSHQEILDSLEKPIYKEFEIATSNFRLVSNQYITTIRNELFLEQFYSLSCEARIALKVELVLGLSLTSEGRDYLRESIEFDSQTREGIYFSPKSHLDDLYDRYIEMSDPNERKFLPMFSLESLEYDLYAIRHKKSSFNDIDRVARFLLKIINETLPIGINFNRKRILYVVGLFVQELVTFTIKNSLTNLTFFISSFEHLEEQLEIDLKQLAVATSSLVSVENIKNGIYYSDLLLSGISTFLKIDEKLRKGLKEGALNVEDVFDLTSAITSLSDELLNHYIKSENLNTFALRKTNLGRSLSILKGLNFSIQVISFYLAMKETSNLYQDGKPKAATAALFFGLSSLISAIGSIMTITTFTVVVPLILVAIGLYITYFMSSDLQDQIKEWFEKNYFGKEFHVIDNTTFVDPTAVTFEWFSKRADFSTSINFTNQISKLHSLLLPLNLSVRTEFELTYYRVELKLVEPVISSFKFYLRLRFFKNDNTEFSKKWSWSLLEGRGFKQENHSFIIPIDLSNEDDRPWSVEGTDGDWWFKGLVSKLSHNSPGGVEYLKILLDMPSQSEELIKYIGIELLVADIYKFKSKEQVEEIFLSPEKPIVIKENRHVVWDQF